MLQRGWEDTWAKEWGMGNAAQNGASFKKWVQLHKMGRVSKNGSSCKKWGGLQRKAVTHREDVEEVVQQAESESAHIAGKAPSVHLEI